MTDPFFIVAFTFGIVLLIAVLDWKVTEISAGGAKVALAESSSIKSVGDAEVSVAQPAKSLSGQVERDGRAAVQDKTLISLMVLGCAAGSPSKDHLLYIYYEVRNGAAAVTAMAESPARGVDLHHLESIAQHQEVSRVAVAAAGAEGVSVDWVMPLPGRQQVIRRALATTVGGRPHDCGVLMVVPLKEDGGEEASFDVQEMALSAHLQVCGDAIGSALQRQVRNGE